MFVKVSFICGKQKRVLLEVKKKTNNMQHEQKENKRL